MKRLALFCLVVSFLGTVVVTAVAPSAYAQEGDKKEPRKKVKKGKKTSEEKKP